MYCITKRNTQTGKKFAELEKKLENTLDAQIVLARKLGIKEWRNSYFVAAGGMSSAIFHNKPDPTVWKNVNQSKMEWMPRLSSKKGKSIAIMIDALPKVTANEVNLCIGMKGHPFKQIGFDFSKKDYFGFTLKEEWGVKIPKDCKEITSTEYHKLFKK